MKRMFGRLLANAHCAPARRAVTAFVHNIFATKAKGLRINEIGSPRLRGQAELLFGRRAACRPKSGNNIRASTCEAKQSHACVHIFQLVIEVSLPFAGLDGRRSIVATRLCKVMLACGGPLTFMGRFLRVIIFSGLRGVLSRR